jgi:hypothetical protein
MLLGYCVGGEVVLSLLGKISVYTCFQQHLSMSCNSQKL